MLLCQEVELLFGYKVRGWQARAIQALLNGTDIMVSASTGSGKSLVFQAMVCASPKAIVLVISPLLSLMDDQVRQNISTRMLIITGHEPSDRRQRGGYHIGELEAEP